MGRIKNAISYAVKGLCLKLFSHKSISFDGLGHFSCKAELITKNNGIIEMQDYVYIPDRASISVDGGTLKIGAHVGINRDMILRCHGRIEIGSGTSFGPYVCMFDHNHKFNAEGVSDDYSVGSIEIGENCWIGANVTILKNTKIGDGCIIGAGCVVSGDIPAHSLVTSNRDLVIRPIENR